MTEQAKSEGKKAVKVRERAPSSRALAYGVLVAAGLPPSIAKDKTGYSRTSTPAIVSASSIPISDRIEAAAAAMGVCLEANLGTLGSIGYNRNEGSTDRISAIKAINDMVGWKAPDKVEVSQHKLSIVSVLVKAIRDDGLSVSEIVRNNNVLQG